MTTEMRSLLMGFALGVAFLLSLQSQLHQRALTRDYSAWFKRHEPHPQQANIPITNTQEIATNTSIHQSSLEDEPLVFCPSCIFNPITMGSVTCLERSNYFVTKHKLTKEMAESAVVAAEPTNCNTAAGKVPSPESFLGFQQESKIGSISNASVINQLGQRVANPVAKEFEDYKAKYLHAVALPQFESRVEAAGWDEAYVNFFTGWDYMDLVQVAIEAVHAFSDRPMLVYVACNLPEEAQQHVQKRGWFEMFPNLVVFSMKKSQIHHPWFDKLRAILIAKVKRGIIVEADTIITPKANPLFHLLESLPLGGLTPLAPQHADLRPNFPKNCPFSKDSCKWCCDNWKRFPFPMKKRTNGQYRHAHVMWTAASKQFLAEEVLQPCVMNPNSTFCIDDEAALNVALWRTDLPTHELCLIDPYIDYWEKIFFSNDTEVGARATQKDYNRRTLAFVLYHGNKVAADAAKKLSQLKDLFQKGWGGNTTKNVPWILENGILTDRVDIPHGLFGEPCLLPL